MDQVLVLLLSAVVCVTVMRRFQLPPILGYLLIGASLGPHGAGLLSGSDLIDILSELGIVFLLFAIGLEMHLSQFLAMRSVLLRLGFLQMGICTAVAAAVLKALGISWAGSLVGGGALALSSTAILLKQMQEQQELEGRVGQLSFGLLIFQDLAAIPFLIAIPVLGSGAEPQALFNALFAALLKGLLAVGVIVWLGRQTLGKFFSVVARARSSEVFMLAVLWVALAAAAITHHLGLSMSMGAFLAGLVLGDSKFRHQVSSDIRPFRDILLGLFFVSVGLSLDLRALVLNANHIVGGLVCLCIFKGFLHAGLGWYFSGRRVRDGARFGLIMAHSGEFGILLLSMAAKVGIIPQAWAQELLAILVLSLFLAVFLVKYNMPWTQFLTKWDRRTQPPVPPEKLPGSAELTGKKVIICGFGRVGQILARFFKKQGIPYVALDLDAKQVNEASRAGQPVFFGDATQADVLHSVGIQEARLAVLCLDDLEISQDVLRTMRRVAPELPVIVRTRDDSHLEQLQEAGATEVVPEILEASLMLVAHVLVMLGFSSEQVFSVIGQAKSNRYRLLKGFYGSDHDAISPDAKPIELRHSIVLCPGSQALGLSISQLMEKSFWGTVRWEEIVRDQQSYAVTEWDPHTVLCEQDVLVVVGPAEEIDRCESALLTGRDAG